MGLGNWKSSIALRASRISSLIYLNIFAATFAVGQLEKILGAVHSTNVARQIGNVAKHFRPKIDQPKERGERERWAIERVAIYASSCRKNRVFIFFAQSVADRAHVETFSSENAGVRISYRKWENRKACYLRLPHCVPPPVAASHRVYARSVHWNARGRRFHCFLMN